MLRVQTQESDGTLIFRLEGRFTGKGADEVRTLIMRCNSKLELLVDLTEVMFIDAIGEEVLLFVRRLGAQFIAETSYSWDVCERLQLPLIGKPKPKMHVPGNSDGNGHHPRRRWLARRTGIQVQWLHAYQLEWRDEKNLSNFRIPYRSGVERLCGNATAFLPPTSTVYLVACVMQTQPSQQAILGVQCFRFLHLAPYPDEIIAKTVEALKQINPDYLIPMHCTGFRTMMAIEREMPQKLIMPSTGTRVAFGG
jgi:hypothetical protein